MNTPLGSGCAVNETTPGLNAVINSKHDAAMLLSRRALSWTWLLLLEVAYYQVENFRITTYIKD